MSGWRVGRKWSVESDERLVEWRQYVFANVRSYAKTRGFIQDIVTLKFTGPPVHRLLAVS